jgi:hypothetical protein
MCLSTEDRKSEDGENPLMRSITEHSLGDKPKYIIEKEHSTQKKREICTKVQG